MDTLLFQESNEEHLLQNSLEQTHISEFNENNYSNGETMPTDCLICLDVIGLSQSSWSCPQCQQILHTDCKEDWNRRLPEPFFTCPHCKFKVLNTMPIIVPTTSESLDTDESEDSDMIQRMAVLFDTFREHHTYCNRYTPVGQQWACACCTAFLGIILCIFLAVCIIDYNFFVFLYARKSNYTDIFIM